MSRPASHASALLAATLLLSGCSGSGFWRYETDTFTLPGANPNRPDGASETYREVRHLKPKRGQPVIEPTPMLTDAGDVWPGPPKAVPTLKDLQRQQAGQPDATIDNIPALPPLPSLPGFEITPPAPSRPVPEQVFPSHNIHLPGGRNLPIPNGQGFTAPPATNGSIVVPNGNGTSTVIGPNGSVSTIPTPGPAK